MKNKKDLMQKLLVLGAAFGYFCFNKLPSSFRVLFIVIIILAPIVYIVEGIKNKYDRASIILSILGSMLGIVLLAYEYIKYKQGIYSQYSGYVIFFMVFIVMTMLIISGVNYMKTANKKESFFVKLFLAFMIIAILGVIIIIAIKPQ